MSQQILNTQLPEPSYTIIDKSKRKLHLAIALSITSVLAIFLIIFLAFLTLAWHLAYPYVPPLQSNPLQAKNLPYEAFVYPSASGKSTVEAWYISSPEKVQSLKRTVILSHGYGTNREEQWIPLYDVAEHLYRLNYNVIMFDYGYASEQYRYPATWGSEEQEQLSATISLAEQLGAEQIIVFGFSMGAGTALQTALNDERIDALLLDSTFIAGPDGLYANTLPYVSLPKKPTLWLLEQTLPLWTNHRLSSEATDQIMHTDYSIPLYFIHGTLDEKASYRVVEQLYNQQSHPLTKYWLVENGYHELLLRKDRKLYLQNVSTFLSSVAKQ